MLSKLRLMRPIGCGTCKRMGHSNGEALHLLPKRLLVKDLPVLHECKGLCGACQLGNMRKLPFPTDGAWRASKKLELVHTDVCGPMKTLSLDESKYFILFIDDFTRMTLIYFMKERSQVFSIFHKWKKSVDN